LPNSTAAFPANATIAGAFAVELLAALRHEAPLASIRFAPEGEVDDEALREGRTDIHIGARRHACPGAPELATFAG